MQQESTVPSPSLPLARSICLKPSRRAISWVFLFIVLSISYGPLLSMDASQFYGFESKSCSKSSTQEALANNEAAPASHTFHINQLADTACRNPAVNLIKVASPEEQHAPGKPLPKILCFVLTHEANHDTRISTIQETWGRKCDKIVIASTVDDPSINAVDMKSKPGYWELWHKLKKTLIYLHETYRTEGYDWILKADDDTYVIMENLKAFLANEAGKGIPKMKNNATGELEDPPMVYGRTVPFPVLSVLDEWKSWFKEKENHWFGNRFRKRFNMSETLVYPHGGPGYVMNWKYVDILVDAFLGDPFDRVRGHVGEDMANAVTMLYRGIRPFSTRDEVTGLERSHPETPEVMYQNPKWLKKKSNIENTGNGTKCCAPSSISYHHVGPEHMRLLEVQVYACRQVLAALEDGNI